MRADVTTSRTGSSSRTTTRLTTLIIAVGIGALLAACSSSGSADAGSPAPAGSGAAGASGQAAASNGSDSAGGSGNGKATCTQLTKDQVQPLLTKPITNVSSASVPDQVSVNGMAQQCTFATGDSQQAIVVTVVGGADADKFYLGGEQAYSTPANVSGIGSKAVRDSGDATSAITAEDNGVSCSANTSGEDQLPGVAALEQAAGDTSDIGDANYAIISTALGTLCNRVFGSGNTTPNLSGLSMSGVTPPADGGLPTGFAVPTDGTN